MLDMIVEGRVFDFGTVYDGWKGFSFFFQRLLGEKKSSDFASYYAQTSSVAENYYNTVIEYFETIS